MTGRGFAAERQPMRRLNVALEEPHHVFREARRPRAHHISYRPTVCTVTQMHDIIFYALKADQYELSLPEAGNELSA